MNEDDLHNNHITIYQVPCTTIILLSFLSESLEKFAG